MTDCGFPWRLYGEGTLTVGHIEVGMLATVVCPNCGSSHATKLVVVDLG